jgi:hypothetical protein
MGVQINGKGGIEVVCIVGRIQPYMFELMAIVVAIPMMPMLALSAQALLEAGSFTAKISV